MGKFGYSNQELEFFTVLINFFYAALSGGTQLQPVMSQQNTCIMELYTKFRKILFSWKCVFPLSYTLIKMIVHAFMIELDHQPDYWYPRKVKNCENLQSQWKNVLLWWYRCGQSSLQRGQNIKLCIISSLKRIIQNCLKFKCYPSKIKFPFKSPFCIYFGYTNQSRTADFQLIFCIFWLNLI